MAKLQRRGLDAGCKVAPEPLPSAALRNFLLSSPSSLFRFLFPSRLPISSTTLPCQHPFPILSHLDPSVPFFSPRLSSLLSRLPPSLPLFSCPPAAADAASSALPRLADLQLPRKNERPTAVPLRKFQVDFCGRRRLLTLRRARPLAAAGRCAGALPPRSAGSWTLAARLRRSPLPSLILS
jgi:hypothetical protein